MNSKILVLAMAGAMAITPTFAAANQREEQNKPTPIGRARRCA